MAPWPSNPAELIAVMLADPLRQVWRAHWVPLRACCAEKGPAHCDVFWELFMLLPDGDKRTYMDSLR